MNLKIVVNGLHAFCPEMLEQLLDETPMSRLVALNGRAWVKRFLTLR